MNEIEINFSKPQPRCYILELTPEDRDVFRRWDYSPQFEAYYWFAAVDAEKAS